MSDARYAVYFAPAVDSAWWRFGAGWLESEGHRLAIPGVGGFSPEQWSRLTAEPRRYGFHATLKAPFRPHGGVTETLLCKRLADLARDLRAQPLERLVPTVLDGFVALVPSPRSPAVDALAASCVLGLDDLRAPLTGQELERRRPERLDELGRVLLVRHGYPHVLGRFRFHMTLSGAVGPATAARLVNAAAAEVERLNRDAPPRLDRLCLFREAEPGAAFERIHDEVLAS